MYFLPSVAACVCRPSRLQNAGGRSGVVCTWNRTQFIGGGFVATTCVILKKISPDERASIRGGGGGAAVIFRIFDTTSAVHKPHSGPYCSTIYVRRHSLHLRMSGTAPISAAACHFLSRYLASPRLAAGDCGCALPAAFYAAAQELRRTSVCTVEACAWICSRRKVRGEPIVKVAERCVCADGWWRVVDCAGRGTEKDWLLVVGKIY